MAVLDDPIITEELAARINARASHTKVPEADRRQLESEAGVTSRQADFWFAHSSIYRPLIPRSAWRTEHQGQGPRSPGRSLSEIRESDPELYARVRVGLALVGEVTQVPTTAGSSPRQYHERYRTLDEVNERIAQMTGGEEGFDPYLADRWFGVTLRRRTSDEYMSDEYPWEIEVDYDNEYEASESKK